MKDQMDRHNKKWDVFFPQMPDGTFRAICLYNGVVAEKCPNNVNSLCSSHLPRRPDELYHVWDGKNAWKCNCG